MALSQQASSARTSPEVLEIIRCNYDSCEGCSNKNSDFYRLLSEDEQLEGFLYKHGVIPCHFKCPKCNAVLKKNTERRFRCQRINRRSKRVCKTQITVYKDSFFSLVHMTTKQIAEVVLLYLSRPPPRYRFIQEETGLSSKTLCNQYSSIREVFIYWAVRNSEQLGGDGVIVEIDETKIEKRKNNPGQYLDGQWLISGIEQDTKKFFLIAVEDRNVETLISVIKDKIKPGTTIFSECWRGYDRLGEDNCQYLASNHSITFVNPVAGTYTQNIERTWVGVKKLVPGRKKSYYEGYLCECLFMMRYSDHKQRLHSFWKSAGQLYPGLPHA